MSHTRVKTTYAVEGPYASTEIVKLYCHHNHSCDIVSFYDENGTVTSMVFSEWETNNNLWDAMNRLWYPYKDKWGDKLKDGVEYYNEIGD